MSLESCGSATHDSRLTTHDFANATSRGGVLMAARRLDGAAVAQAIRDEIRPGVVAFAERAGRPPGLGVVLVGDDPASEIYVRNKLKAAGEIGFRADLDRLPATASLAELLTVVE